MKIFVIETLRCIKIGVHMKIIRYSNSGYKAQEQSYHKELYKYHMEYYYSKQCSESFKPKLKAQYDFYLEHKADFEKGIWCFIDGYKNNQSLNHLTKKVACWEAEVPDDIECYDCNWEKLITISDPIVLAFGCYIPERELHKITNIKRRKPNSKSFQK